MANLDEQAMAKLAREMVMGIRNYKTIFADFNLTEEDYYEVLKNDYYRKIKEHFTIEWNSTISTADRVRLQGLAGTEVLMPVAIQRAMQPTEPLTSIIEALKTTAKIGGLSETKNESKNTAERFIITINIGNKSKTYDKSIQPEANDIDLTAQHQAIEAPT